MVTAGIVLAPVFLAFRLRLIAAGDGKLMGLIAGWLGIDAGLRAIGLGIAIGAVWSLCRLWRDKDLRVRLVYLSAYFRRVFLTMKITAYEAPAGDVSKVTIPLGACLSAGAYLYLLYSWAAGAGKGFL